MTLLKPILKKLVKRIGYDVRKITKTDTTNQQFAARVIADSKLLSDRYRVELVRALGLSADGELSAWEDDCIHLSMANPPPKPKYILKQQDVPLILGPWMSEVGFELLYWIPLLRHWRVSRGVAPQRLIALSRGGVASWYSGIACQYVDIFDLCSEKEFREGNEQREAEVQGKKQFQMGTFEREIVRRAADRLQLKDHACVHPSLMYQFFKTWWTGTASIRSVTAHCDHSRLLGIYDRPRGIPFKEYVAVKFYHSDCFPKNSANTAFVRDCVRRLAQKNNVVLLNTGLKLDDHSDCSATLQLPNVFDASSLMDPRTNLEVQSAIVANSRQLCCTYGGFSYLGPLLNVPTLSFYSKTNFVCEHLDVANRVFNHSRPMFSVLPTSEAQTLLGDQVDKHDREFVAA